MSSKMAPLVSKIFWLTVFYISLSYLSSFPVVESSRMLIGGFRPMNLSDDSDQENSVLARNLADFAARKIDLMSNHDFWHTVTRIVSVESQLVNGMNYRVTFYEAQTDCKKRTGKIEKNSCKISSKSNASFRKCTVIVYKPFDSDRYSLGNQFQCDNVAKSEAVFENFAESNGVSENQTVDQSETTQYYHDYNGSTSYDLQALNFVFEEFRKIYRKTYGSFEESQKRFENFVENLEVIRTLRKYEKGTAQYGVTEFTDLSYEEFLKLHTGYRRSNNVKKAPISPLPLKDIPQEVDWRKQGAVTEVKNQGSCGSCWAFSTTGNIESVWKIKKGQLVSLSEQQLVDCDKIDQGCNGGEMSDAYKEIERMGGLETEREYPYNARRKTCHFNKTEVSVYINDSVSLPHDERQMAQYVAERGPISIGINAAAMMFYFGGVSHPWSITCWKHHLNHGVLIVGYGVEKNKPYWLIKNSWGPHWGESGYYRIYRGDGSCGVDQDPSSVIIK